METQVRIYRERYQGLPERFVRKIDQDLRYLLEKKIPGLRQIFLFGSCARGQVRSTSDVDLLIVTEEKLADRRLAAEIRWTLDEAENGVRTDVVYQNQREPAPESAFQKVLERDKKLILEVVD